MVTFSVRPCGRLSRDRQDWQHPAEGPRRPRCDQGARSPL